MSPTIGFLKVLRSSLFNSLFCSVDVTPPTTAEGVSANWPAGAGVGSSGKLLLIDIEADRLSPPEGAVATAEARLSPPVWTFTTAEVDRLPSGPDICQSFRAFSPS